jgi:AcrR family transcriptional regulator
MNVTPARQKFKLEIRRQIMSTARDLFVHEGYASFSMRRLAQRLGYPPSALYRYFNNKNEIFNGLIEESFAALLQASSSVQKLTGEAPIERLKRGMWAYVTFGLENPEHYRFAFVLRHPDGVDKPSARPTFEGLKSRVRRCVEEGEFDDRDLDLMAQSLWAAVHGVTSLLIQRPDFPWVTQQALIDQVISSAVLGLSRTAASGADRAAPPIKRKIRG